MEIRNDTARIEKSSKTEAGFLRAPARLTRVGIFEYRSPDGTMVRELRPPEEVFAPESLDSLRMVPLTLRHPDGGVDAKTARAQARGSVGENVVQDGEYVSAMIGVHDSDLVDAIESGAMRELSCGYSCKVDETPGEWNGQPYDRVQRNIRYNHVALVERGRAGSDVRIRMDQKQEIKMAKIKVGEKEVEVADEIKAMLDTLEAKNAALEATAATMVKKDAVDAEKARADALEAKVKELPSLVKARAQLERSASEFVDAEKFDSMTDAEIQRAVITKVLPEVKLDGASDAYLAGAYAVAVKASPAAEGAAAIAKVVGAGEQRKDAKSPRDLMIERQNQAHKPAAKENK